MPERMRGVDAYYLHFESERVRAHTLKCLVLDPRRRGRPLRLQDVRAAISPRLGLHPRARQRAMKARGVPGAPVWVDDPGFDLDAHLSELALPDPTRGALDAVASRLATEPLDLDRPLWDATLVHGLPRGVQALFVRMHHALGDGMAVANMLATFTTDEPGTIPAPERDDWNPGPVPTEQELRTLALQEVPSYGARAATFAKEFAGRRAERKATLRQIRERDDLLGARPAASYGWTAPPLGPQRRCASAHLPLTDVRKVTQHHGVTVNTVLLAVVGEAVRAEEVARGTTDPPDQVASMSVALNTDTDRLTGNDLSPVFVKLHTDEHDLERRLQKIAGTTADAVANTRAMVDGRSVRFADLIARATPVAVRLADQRTKTINANVVTACVKGPASTRWLGDVEVIDFISWAMVVPPIGLNVTMYSYADRVSVGVLTTPDVTETPHAFTSRMHRALDDLVATT